MKEPAMQESKPPIDLDQIRQFTDGDYEEEKEFFGVYLDQAQECISGLGRALLEGNNSQYEGLAHKLKGMSANIGANHIASLCKQAELDFEKTSADKEKMLEKIKSEFLNIESYIKSLYKE